MSDSPFQRQGSGARAKGQLGSMSPPHTDPPVVVDVLPPGPTPHTSSPTRVSDARRGRLLVVVGVAGAILGGLGVGAFTVGPRPPDPMPLTIDSFPREVLGKTREDVEFRDAGSTAVVARLDAQFENQLKSYRFAYGGDGAKFKYGGYSLILTIVNGRLAPTVPVEDGGIDWEIPTVVSLTSDETSCISHTPAPAEEPLPEEFPLELGTGTVEVSTNESVMTDCVLVDSEHNVSLRLVGYLTTGSGDAITTAAVFRDELERIRATLVN